MTTGQAHRLRMTMVDTQIASRDIDDPRVLEAMRRVPRHRFVPDATLADAYADRPLAIPQGQTISQPYMVALMAQELELRPEDRVLEVGTGCGYAAAVLAELAGEVWTVERHAPLASEARERLDALGYRDVHVIVGDGSAGHAPGAPYDAIVVAAAAPAVPDPLVEQLAEGGRLVIPVDRGPGQDLLRLRRVGSAIDREVRARVRFVPLIAETSPPPSEA
jgi:protein-L-isoaspartate(D-aspartate) O-methyltransferase